MFSAPCAEWQNGQLKGKKKKKIIPNPYQRHSNDIGCSENNIGAKNKKEQHTFLKIFMFCSKIFGYLAPVVTLLWSGTQGRETSTILIPLTESNRALTSKTNPHHAVVGGMHFFLSPALEIKEFLKRGDKLLTFIGFLTGIQNS